MDKSSRWIPFIPLLLAAAGAQEISPDTTRLVVEASFRMGGLSGPIIDREGALYDDVGLRFGSNASNATSVDPSGTDFGFDFGAYWRFQPYLQTGVAFLYQWTATHPGSSSGSSQWKEILSEKAVLARLRYLPFQLGKARLGVEGGIGPSFGVLHRMALAADQTSLLAPGAIDYVQAANRPVDVSGLRYEAAFLATQDYGSHFGVNLRAGFHHTSLGLKGSDPLANATPSYSFPVASYGFDLAVGLFGRF